MPRVSRSPRRSEAEAGPGHPVRSRPRAQRSFGARTRAGWVAASRAAMVKFCDGCRTALHLPPPRSCKFHLRAVSVDRGDAGAIGRHRLADLQHRQHAAGARPRRRLPVPADVPAHASGRRNLRPLRPAQGLCCGTGTAGRLLRDLYGPVAEGASQHAAVLRDTGAVRRRARFLRAGGKLACSPFWSRRNGSHVPSR